MGYISLCYTAEGASGEKPGEFVLILNNWDCKSRKHIQSNCVETNTLWRPQVYNLDYEKNHSSFPAFQQTAGNQSSLVIKQSTAVFVSLLVSKLCK